MCYVKLLYSLSDNQTGLGTLAKLTSQLTPLSCLKDCHNTIVP